MQSELPAANITKQAPLALWRSRSKTTVRYSKNWKDCGISNEGLMIRRNLIRFKRLSLLRVICWVPTICYA